MKQDVVVVGGGIIGVTAAWYLTRAGWQVTVVDRGQIGAACSHGNCGLVCPSHVIPLTEPGAFGAAVKALLSTNSPFRIQPRLDPALWSWLWQFGRRCNERSMIQAAHAIQAQLSSAMVEYEKLVGEEQIECEWQAKGLLFVFLDRKPWEAYASTNKLLTELFHEPAKQLDARETISLEPALQETIAGSWYYEHDAHLRPDKLLTSLRQRLESQGVTFVEHCEFQEVRGSGAIAAAITTTGNEFSASQFVFASGAWTPMYREQLGCYVPIQPGKGYSITMPRPASCPELPVIFPQHRVVATPMHSGYRLGSIMEFAGYDESIRPDRLQLLREGAAHYLREPYCEPETEAWFGWRPMTYDSVPVIDRSPRWSNVWVATGHNMLGLSMAPATGRLLAEMMSGLPTHISPEPYALSRFKSS